MGFFFVVIILLQLNQDITRHKATQQKLIITIGEAQKAKQMQEQFLATATAMKDEQWQCLDLGMNDYMTKPFEFTVSGATWIVFSATGIDGRGWSGFFITMCVVFSMDLQNAFGRIYSKETYGPTTIMTVTLRRPHWISRRC